MRETDWGYQRLAIRNSVSLKSAAFRWHRRLSSVIKNSLEGSARTRAFDICCGWGIAGSIHERKFRKGRADNFSRSGRDEPESERSQPLHPLQRRSKGSLLSGFTSAHSGNRDLSSIKTEQPLAPRVLFSTIVLASSLFSFSVVASEAPECDPEEIRLYSSNPTEEITDAVVSHLDELARAKNGYEGFPDLACLLNLYAINDADDAPSAVEKAKWLLDRTPTDAMDALLVDASKSGSFIFDTFYKDGMCLFHRLADSVASSQVCAPGLEAINLEIERLQVEQKALIAESSSSELIEDSDGQSLSGNEDEQLVWCVLGIGTLEIFVAQHSREVCKERDGLGFNKRQTALQVKEKQEEILAEKRKEEDRQKEIREAEERKKAETEKERKRKTAKNSSSWDSWCARYPNSFVCEQQESFPDEGSTEDQPDSSDGNAVKTKVVYQPLLIRAKPSDERFCYQVWKTQIRDTDGDPNKQTGIDFCWDFLNLEGTWWIAAQENLVLRPARKKLMENNFEAHMMGAQFLGGFVASMYRVARALRVGRGVRRDEQKAFEFYLKAANKKHTKSQYFVGLMYIAGMGVAKDLTEGVVWIKKAVSAGDGDAKAYLGYLSEFGIGVSKDIAEAKRLYREAARMQHPFAKERLQAIGAG